MTITPDEWLRCRQKGNPASANRRIGPRETRPCSLLVASPPFGGAHADAPKEKNAKVTLVYQHKLPNVPGKSIKGVVVEYGPGGYSPSHTHPKSAFAMLGRFVRSISNARCRCDPFRRHGRTAVELVPRNQVMPARDK